MYFIDIESVSYTIDGKSINACVNFKVFGGLEMRLQRYYFFLKCTNFSERFFRLYGNRSTLCCETPKNILDGSYLVKFWYISKRRATHSDSEVFPGTKP